MNFVVGSMILLIDYPAISSANTMTALLLFGEGDITVVTSWIEAVMDTAHEEW